MFLFRFVYWCFSFVVKAITFTAIGLIALVYAETKIEYVKEKAATHQIDVSNLSKAVKSTLRAQVIALQEELDRPEQPRKL